MRTVSILFSLALASVVCERAHAQTFPKPGPEHEALKKMEGTWDATLAFPGNLKVKGTLTCKMECGGLWLVRDLETNFRGLKMQTKGMDGYDPVKKKHVSVQFDSMTTIPMVLEGTYDEAAKTLTQTGEARDFDGSPEQVRSVIKHVDADHQTVEVYRVYADGKIEKHLTIQYTRRKQAESQQPKSP